MTTAPTPELGRQLSGSKLTAPLRRVGRQRRVDEHAEQIQAALRADQLATSDVVSTAMSSTVTALFAVITELVAQIGRLEAGLAEHIRTSRVRR